MAKKAKRSKPLKGALTTRVDMAQPEADAFTYVLGCQAQVAGKGSDHKDVLARLNHFLNHATIRAIMEKCGLESMAFKVMSHGVLDRERKRVIEDADSQHTILHPRTGRPVGGH